MSRPISALAAYRGFAIAVIPAAIGGAIWSTLGLPLAWLMGAAIVTGFMSGFGLSIELPKLLYWPSLAVIGAGVGLTITPSVAVQIAAWFPFMAVMGFAGVILAALLTPFVARCARIETSTAFFSLMPGGVIEMANIGEPHGADRTTIATLHAIRVALVVGILPLGLYLYYPDSGVKGDRVLLEPRVLAKMLEAAAIGPKDLVLELAPATGYSTALISKMAEAVIAIEPDETLAAQAQQSLARLEVDNAVVSAGDPAVGDAAHAPFDVILVNGAVTTLPEALTDQLRDGGRLVAIFAEDGRSQCRVLTRSGAGLSERYMFDAAAPVLAGFDRPAAFSF